jgi:hypothetical protein
MTNNGSGRMTKTSMPLRRRDANSTEHLMGTRRIHAIEAMTQLPAKKNVPRGSILNKKIKRVKLTKNIIIMSEPRN